MLAVRIGVLGFKIGVLGWTLTVLGSKIGVLCFRIRAFSRFRITVLGFNLKGFMVKNYGFRL